MDWMLFFQSFPPAGWVAVFMVLIIIGLLLFELLIVIKSKTIKIRNVEIANASEQELYQATGKDVFDNQTTVAHNLLRQVWVDLYEIGKKKFNITEPTELFLLEDIAHLIEFKLNHDVKNDLIRNHITKKSEEELKAYSEAKAVGYYSSVKTRLYSYNTQLPKYDLPDILDEISVEDYKKMFYEIYLSTRKIANPIEPRRIGV